MRLIDAEKLSESYRKSINECKRWFKEIDNSDENMKARAEQSMMSFMECDMRLKLTPTVNAIPVDWLRKFRDSKVTKESQKTLEEVNGDFVEWAIVEWEKQNEVCISDRHCR